MTSMQSIVSAINSNLAKNPETKGIKFGVPTTPIVFQGNTAVGQGLKFRSWLMGGLDTTLGTGVDVDTSSGYQFAPSRGQEFPPNGYGKPVDSTDVYSTLEAVAINYLDTLFKLPHSEYNMSQYSAKAASGSTLQHLTNFINQAAAQNSLTAKQVQVYRAAVLLVYEKVVLSAVEGYPTATEGSYGWYSDEVKEAADNAAGNIEDNGSAGGGSGMAGGSGSGSGFIGEWEDFSSEGDGESLMGLPVVFADGTGESGNVVEPMEIPLGNILSLSIGGNKFLFDTTSYGIELSKDFSGVANIVMTCNDNNLYLMVEPVFWLVPEHYGWRGSSRPTRCGGHGVRFYGTPTNYAKWAMVYKNLNGTVGWDGYCSNNNPPTYTESNYKFALGLGITQSLVLQRDFAGYKAPALKSSGSFWSNAEVADTNNKVGVALQAYSLKMPKGLPPQRTWNGDPGPGEVPDPDKIPVEQGEPTEPGDPLTPDQWDNPEENPIGEPTQKNTTRTIKIVKVYQFEDKYGNLYHEATYHTDSNPGTITIQNEPEYKVAEYFTSPDYYEWVDLAVGEDGKYIPNGDGYTRTDGTSSAITPETPWSEF